MKRLPVGQIIALCMMLVALVAVILLKGECARAVGGYFDTLEPAPAPSRPAR